VIEHLILGFRCSDYSETSRLERDPNGFYEELGEQRWKQTDAVSTGLIEPT
jgi:hypothetical protein